MISQQIEHMPRLVCFQVHPTLPNPQRIHILQKHVIVVISPAKRALGASHGNLGGRKLNEARERKHMKTPHNPRTRAFVYDAV